MTNTHKVPKKQWNKWSDEARRVFNELFEMLRDNQEIMLHPNQDAITPRFWKTTCWNMAWLAADAVDGKL